MLAPTENASWGDSRHRSGPGPPQPQTAPAPHLGAGNNPPPPLLAPPPAFKEPPPLLGCEPVPGGKLSPVILQGPTTHAQGGHCSGFHSRESTAWWPQQSGVHLKRDFTGMSGPRQLHMSPPAVLKLHVAVSCWEQIVPSLGWMSPRPFLVTFPAHQHIPPPSPSHLGTASNLCHPLPASRQFAIHFNPPHPRGKMKRIIYCSHFLVARIKNSVLTLSQVP